MPSIVQVVGKNGQDKIERVVVEKQEIEYNEVKLIALSGIMFPRVS